MQSFQETPGIVCKGSRLPGMDHLASSRQACGGPVKLASFFLDPSDDVRREAIFWNFLFADRRSANRNASLENRLLRS